MKHETIYVLMPVEVMIVTDEEGPRVGSVTMPTHEYVESIRDATEGRCNFKTKEEAEEAENEGLLEYFCL